MTELRGVSVTCRMGSHSVT